MYSRLRFSVFDWIVYRKDTTDADFDMHMHMSTDAGPGSGSSPAFEGGEEAVNDAMQTFVFSATLSKDLQRNLKKRGWKGGVGAGAGKNGKGKEVASTLGMSLSLSLLFVLLVSLF